MRIEHKKVVKVDELAHLIPTKAGATFSQLWQVFYYTRLLKYVTYDHYIHIKRSFNKICTYKKLQELCRLGYLKSPRHEVYCATDKVLPILKEAGFITETLPAQPTGTGDINEINNTTVFIQALKLEYFYTLLYPQFREMPDSSPYLIPDALLIQKDLENKLYKLTFLEVELKKPDWDNYLENKRDNYLRLAKDINFYHYWASVCPLLGFPPPDVSTLGFSVCFVGNITKDFGEGFRFTTKL